MITCQFEDGAKTNLRHVVVDMLVVDGDQILLVKRAPHFLEGDKYALVGGYLDLHETLEHCVKREAREETGYDIELDKLFLIVDNQYRKNDERNNLVFTYIVKPLKKVAEPDDESTDIRWFKLDALPPASQLAFDHEEMIQRYKEYTNTPFPTPLIISK